MPAFILLLFVVSDSLQPHELYPAMLLCPRDFSVKNTGVGCNFLSQGISPRIEPKSSVWQVDSLPLSHQGSPPSSSQQISTELVRQCCRFWGCHSHQETKCLSFWSLSSPEEVEKQANAYVTKSQC